MTSKNNAARDGLSEHKELTETYHSITRNVQVTYISGNGLIDGEEFTVEPFTFKILSAAEATAVITGHVGDLPESLDIPGVVSIKGGTVKVTEIAERAFRDCKTVQMLVIPDSVIIIREKAFYGCSKLQEITISANVQSIGNFAFDSCTDVCKITCLAETPPVTGVYDDGSSMIPFCGISRRDCVVYVPEKSVFKYQGNRKNIKGWRHFFHILPIGGEMPDTANDRLPVFDKSWKKIAFVDGKAKPKLDGIQRAWVEEGTEEIPADAFMCLEDLYAVYIPASVKKIGQKAFCYSHNLEHIYFEDGGGVAFENLFMMFEQCSHLSDLSFMRDWNTAEVISMKSMFERCPEIKDLSPLSGWNTGKVQDFSFMFSHCGALSDISALSGWNLASSKDISGMFAGTAIPNVSALASWNTHSVENICALFCGCESLKDIDGLARWDVSNVTDMSSLFGACPSLKNFKPLSDWNTGSVTKMKGMFYRSKDDGIVPEFPKFANWNTGKVKTLQSFFHDRQDIKDLDCLAGMDVSSVTNLDETFSDCKNLSDISALSSWHVEKVERLGKMFSGCSSLQDLTPLSRWDVSKCAYSSEMFMDCVGLTGLCGLEDWKWSSLHGLSYLFCGCRSLKDISALAGWDIRRMESLDGLFKGCVALADLSALALWDLSNVNSVSYMFNGCESLTDLTPLKNWDTCILMDFQGLFAGCKELTDVSPIAHWNMRRKEIHLEYAFKGCSKLTDVKCLDWLHGSVFLKDTFVRCGKSEFKMRDDFRDKVEPILEEKRTIDAFEVKENADGVMEFTSGDISFAMVPVEGGRYVMGYKTDDPNYYYGYRNKAHDEIVGDFYIGRTQVTQELWEAVMGNNPSNIPGLKLPVEWVSWDECMDFVKRLNEITGLKFNLPTQPEWEYAARGGKFSRGYKFAGSDDYHEVAWCCGTANWTTHPVGLKKPNELGLFDMTGNVREWCLETDDYYTDCHINRGGCFHDSGTDWCDIFHYDYSRGKGDGIGLRLVLHKENRKPCDTIVTQKVISAERKHDVYYDKDGSYLGKFSNRAGHYFYNSGVYTEKCIAVYDITYERTYRDKDGNVVTEEIEQKDFLAKIGEDVKKIWQDLNDEHVRVNGAWTYRYDSDGKIILNDWHAQLKKYAMLRMEYNRNLFTQYGCKVETWQDAKKIVIKGKEIIFYVNDNGAIIEIKDVRPNTFEDGFYYKTGCTVDVDINIYSDDFKVKIPRTLEDVDTGTSCWDWFDGYWECELEYILDCEDEDGNYDGPEEDKAFYEAAKKCRDNGWDFCDKYDWEKFRTEKDYEEYCWDLITNTDYTFDQIARTDAISKGVRKIDNRKEVYEAVDVEGTFEIYEAAAPLGDGMLYGDLLFKGRYSIKAIRKGTEKEMMERTVKALCKWAGKKDYEKHNHLSINTKDFKYGKTYFSNLKGPVVDVQECSSYY